MLFKRLSSKGRLFCSGINIWIVFRVAKPETLPEQVFEVDAEADGKDEEHYKIRPLQITHKGWLYKGPDGNQETSLISFTRVSW